jgi:DNA processing protein
MDETQLSAETLAPLDDSERFDWLRLLRCENIRPRTLQVLLSRQGSAGAALAALPALIASGKARRPIRIATIEEIEREVEATPRAGAAPPVIAVRGNVASLRRSKIAIVGARNASAACLHGAACPRNCESRACHRFRPSARDRRTGASGNDREWNDRGPCRRFGEYLPGRT